MTKETSEMCLISNFSTVRCRVGCQKVFSLSKAAVFIGLFLADTEWNDGQAASWLRHAEPERSDGGVRILHRASARLI